MVLGVTTAELPKLWVHKQNKKWALNPTRAVEEEQLGMASLDKRTIVRKS